MTTDDLVPEFAIVGHPNEGKSAVVSTLAEDDSVRVSPYPSETLVCQTFPVIVDGREIIRFTDTPGFQNPNRVLAWMKSYRGDGGGMVQAFMEAHASDPDFKHDRELFKPIARGAGIIYVVDGSRPLRQVDLAEMEILRLTGRPRMAILNPKEDETGYLDQWKGEFRKNFNAIRIFNAHKATYAERLDLLENLKGIDQDWEKALETVIMAFKDDWRKRNRLAAGIILDLLEGSLAFQVARGLSENDDEEALKDRLRRDYEQGVAGMENEARQKLRALYKHNIFKYDLPPQSILREDLFDEKTWRFLGLTEKQLILAAGISGGAVGAMVDLAAAGITFGVFSAIGGAIGAGWTALGGAKRLAGSKVAGIKLGGRQVQVGPARDIQFMYVLLDRALLFYQQVINWAHGRRDYQAQAVKDGQAVKTGLTSSWDSSRKGACQSFFSAIRGHDDAKKHRSRQQLRETLERMLLEISHSDQEYGLMGN